MLRLTLCILVTLTVGTAQAQWERIGPDGVPSNIFKVDSLLYGITEYGFYRSSDDGETWKILDKGLPKPFRHSLGLHFDGFEFWQSASSFQRTNKDSGFYVLGQHDEWVYFDKSYSALHNFYTRRKSLDSFITILTNYAGIDSTAVYLTSDRGKTWSRRLTLSDLYPWHLDWIQHRLFVQTSSKQPPYEPIFLHSDDHGLTWRKNTLQTLPNTCINLYDLFPDVIFATGVKGEIPFARSTDGGTTWQGVQGLPQDHYPTACYSIDSLAFVTVSGYLTYISKDRGKFWQPLKARNKADIPYIAKNNAGDGFVAMITSTIPGKSSLPRVFELDNELFIKEAKQNVGFKTNSHWLLHAYYDFLFAMDHTFYNSYYVSTDSMLFSRDGGQSWEKLYLDAGLGMSPYPWNKGNKYVYTTGTLDSAWGTCLRSSDNGFNWEAVCPVDSLYYAWPTIMALTNDTLILDCGGDTYWLTTDGGSSWNTFQTDSAVQAFCFLNGYVYYLTQGLDQKIFRSSDRGSTWENTYPTLNEDLVKLAPPITFTDLYSANTVLYVLANKYNMSSNTNDLYLFRSSDEGKTWKNISDRFPDLSWRIDIVQDGGVTYLLSENDHSIDYRDGFPHLYSSNDNGESWEQLNNNIPEATHLFVTRSHLIVSSFEGGIYRQSKVSATVDRHSQADEEAQIFPNPSHNAISVRHFAKHRGFYTYTIVGMSGQIITTTSQFIDEPGDITFEYPVVDLPAGVYCINITGPGMNIQKLFTTVK